MENVMVPQIVHKIVGVIYYTILFGLTALSIVYILRG